MDLKKAVALCIVTIALTGLVALTSACGGTSGTPTSPTPGTPSPSSSAAPVSFTVQFVLASAGSSFTHSDLLRCVDSTATSCTGPTRPVLSSPIFATTTMENYSASPGRYQLMGTLRRDPIMGAALGFLLLGPDKASGIAMEVPHISFFMDDAPQAAGSVSRSLCGGHVAFAQDGGVLEWSLVFNVVRTQTYGSAC